MGINTSYIQGYTDSITGIINNLLVPALISIAFIVFLWGIYNYFIAGADNDAKKVEGRNFSLYGIIGFVVIFSVWGIVQIFIGTLGLTSGGAPPSFPTIGSVTGSSNPTGSLFPTGGTGGVGGGGSPVTQAQASSNLSQAYKSYASCMSKNGDSSSCTQQFNVLSEAQKIYDATGGSFVPVGKCIGGNDGVGGTCPSGYDCVPSGYCVSNGNGATGAGGTLANGNQCTYASECASGYCTNQICTDSSGRFTNGLPNGSNCITDSVCASEHCDLSINACTEEQGGTCSNDSDCDSSLTCNGGMCTLSGEQGGSCHYDSDCGGDLTCDGGICSSGGEQNSRCLGDSDCGNGLSCVNGSCVVDDTIDNGDNSDE